MREYVNCSKNSIHSAKALEREDLLTLLSVRYHKFQNHKSDTFDKNVPSKGKGSDFSLLELKLIKFVMLFFKQKLSFSLNFGLLFSFLRDKSSVLFLLKLYMIWIKGTHQSAKFQTLNCSCKISPNLYLDRLLNLCKILAKNYRGVMSHDPEDWCKNWKKMICFFKNRNILVKFDLNTRRSPNFAKYLMFNLKKYRGLKKGNAKFEEKLTCGLENDMGNIANFQLNT